VDFCQFLQENEIKRKKAEARINQEETAYNDKIKEIESIRWLIVDVEGQIDELF
jgi:hypothetical protein